MEKNTVLEKEPLEKELKRILHKKRYRQNIKKTVMLILCILSSLVIIYAFFVPVLKIKNVHMGNFLKEGDIAAGICAGQYRQGDIIAFFYGKEILIKRVIAKAGDTVDIDEFGNVYVNEEILDEDYLIEKIQGECSTSFPVRVPDGCLFVLNDDRSVPSDSRDEKIGCIDEKNVICRLMLRIYPFEHAGWITGEERYEEES